MGPAVWRPKALNGLELRKAADGKWEWVKNSKGKEALVIQEALFPLRESLYLDSVQPDISFEGLFRYAPVMLKKPAPQVTVYDSSPAFDAKAEFQHSTSTIMYTYTSYSTS